MVAGNGWIVHNFEENKDEIERCFTAAKRKRSMAEQVTNHRENLLQHFHAVQRSDRVTAQASFTGRGKARLLTQFSFNAQ